MTNDTGTAQRIQNPNVGENKGAKKDMGNPTTKGMNRNLKIYVDGGGVLACQAVAGRYLEDEHGVDSSGYGGRNKVARLVQQGTIRNINGRVKERENPEKERRSVRYCGILHLVSGI